MYHFIDFYLALPAFFRVLVIQDSDKNQFVYNITVKMGSYCCQIYDKNQSCSPLRIKKKASLSDPELKKKYEQSIGALMNAALAKYKEKKTVQAIEIKGVLGRGGQGAVFLIEMTSENKLGESCKQQYAMKRISKQKLDVSRVREALLLESRILSSHSSPFLTEIQYGFQDSSYLYYVMELARGGDFYSFLTPGTSNSAKTQIMLSKFLEVIKFVLAGIILGLEYLHQMGVIYLDLKPENVLIYADGYPKLADFGIVVNEGKNADANFFRGTAIYSSPEMIRRKKFGKSADLWSLGILTYQLLTGKTPFSHKLIGSKYFDRAINDFETQPNFGKSSIPESSKDFISALLKNDPHARLGFKSFQEIKSHAFFADFDWVGFQEKTLQSPLKDFFNDQPEINLEENQRLSDLIETEVFQRLSITFVRQSSETESSCDCDQKSPINGFYESQDDDQMEEIILC